MTQRQQVWTKLRDGRRTSTITLKKRGRKFNDFVNELRRSGKKIRSWKSKTSSRWFYQLDGRQAR